VAVVVRQLRRASERAVGPVLDVTGMEAPFEDHVSVVVGRPEWVRSNVRQMRTAIEPIAHLLRDREPPAPVRAIGSRASAVQMGAVLAWLAVTSFVDVAPVAEGQPATVSVVYDPPLMMLAWLLATTAGVLAVLGVGGLRRGRRPLAQYTP